MRFIICLTLCESQNDFLCSSKGDEFVMIYLE